MCGLAVAAGTLLHANVRRSLEREVDGRLWAQAIELSQVIVPADGDHFEVELTPRQIEQFQASGPEAPYYSIWAAGGTLIDSSEPSIDIPPPAAPQTRYRGERREVSVRGPGDTTVLVGQSMEQQQEQLRTLAALILGVGAAGVFLVLAAGWFLAGRALAPIQRVSRAVTAVSALNLAERINVADMEAELAELAESFNDAFDRIGHAFEQQTRFTADASHELRTPLTIVLSQADLALRQPRSENEYREMLESIRRAAQRMKGVVEGLLTLARADAGQTALRTDRFDLSDLVAETCDLLQPIAAERNVTIERRLARGAVVGDRDRLGEAVANLLSNAIRYNVPGGRVDVTLTAAAEKLTLQIADTGPGISAEDRRAIFERFYRVDKARSRSVDGSGLGLAITKWIVDAHGGEIAVRNGPQGGAIFDVTLRRDTTV